MVVESSSQVGKSEIVNNIIGYYIDCDPGPMLMIQPTIEMAQDYSKRRIAPMVRDTEVLAAKVAEAKTRDLNNTILMKIFPGGFLAMGGANSPAGLASRPIRILLGDEVDRYPDSAGSEGDPLMLAERRTTTFWNRKIIYVSTPTIAGASRIEEEYEKGTQERWCVACPSCGSYEYIEFRDIRFRHERHSTGRKVTFTVTEVRWCCPACKGEHLEYVMKRQPARWIADNPGNIKVRSFKLNAFLSPWSSWDSISLEFLQSKDDPEKLKVVTNTLFGESWEERGEVDSEDELLERRETYGAELPEGVLCLTCGVDTQDDRLEYEVVGWGHQEECWGIQKGFIIGVPDNKSTWERLDTVLTKQWSFADGKQLPITITFIDSGGHFTKEVYQFAKVNESRRIFAIKGQGGDGVPFTRLPSRNNDYKVALFSIGVDAGKERITSRLKIKEKGSKYCHFPLDEAQYSDRGYDRAYFEGLLSERKITRKKSGQITYGWAKVREGIANEALDCRNYALAALNALAPEGAREQYFDHLEAQLKGQSEHKTAQPQRQQQRRGVVSKGISY